MADINAGEGPSKTFAESFRARIVNSFFYLDILSGEEVFSFILPLPLAKALGQGIEMQIKEIEEKIGQKIPYGNTEGPMLSPWSPPPPDQNKK